MPDARLLLKGKSFADRGDARVVPARAAQARHRGRAHRTAGLAAGGTAHLALYDRVDIALDPFPYNGTTTTCEALVDGRAGGDAARQPAMRRASAPACSPQAGLTDWIADSIDAYVEIALALAANPERLNTCAARCASALPYRRYATAKVSRAGWKPPMPRCGNAGAAS